MATSVPAPMAMPTSARARAGASLMPSPTMATFLPCLLQRARPPAPCPAGSTSATTWPMPSCLPDGLGGALVVAGEHDHVDAHLPAAPRWPARLVGLTTSATAITPKQPCRLRQSTAASCPAPPSRARPAQRAAERDAVLLHHAAGCPPDSGCLSTSAATPWPGTASKSRHLRAGRCPRSCGLLHNGLGQRVLRGLFQRGGDRQQLLLGDAARRAQISVTRGLPSVMVPVLSSTTVSIVCGGLQRLGGFDEDAVFRALAGAHHDGHRRGQPQRAGAGDDQHRNADGERELTAYARAAARPRRRSRRWR